VLVQRPSRVRSADARRVLGNGAGAGDHAWRRVDHETFGEQDTIELLDPALGSRRAAHAAAGWRGGESELWRRGPLPDPACAAPCRRDDALTIGWRLSGPAAAGELDVALESWLTHVLHARQAVGGRQLWRLPGGSAAAIGTTIEAGEPGSVRLALAPTAALAARLIR
jgi:hypothetical protein